MFDETMIVAALMMSRKQEEDAADRRAFYGPDAQPEAAPQRKRVRLPRFSRRAASA